MSETIIEVCKNCGSRWRKLEKSSCADCGCRESEIVEVDNE